MRDEWTVLRLGDAVEIKHGFAFPGSEFSTDPGYPTVVTPGNFRIGGGFQQTKVKTPAEKSLMASSLSPVT